MADNQQSQGANKARRWRNGLITAGLIAAASIIGLQYKGRQAQVPTTQPAPRVEYVDKTVEAKRGFRLKKAILSSYFKSPSIEDVVKKTAEYNNLKPNSKLREGQPIQIYMDFGNEQKYMSFPAKKDGDTIYEVVRRAVRDENNRLAEKNGFVIDNRAIVPIAYVDEQKLDLVRVLPSGYAVVIKKDGITADHIPEGKKVVLYGYKVPKGLEEEKSKEPKTTTIPKPKEYLKLPTKSSYEQKLNPANPTLEARLMDSQLNNLPDDKFLRDFYLKTNKYFA